jgi:hypothetical protein
MKPLILLLLLAQTADPVTESRKLAGEAMEAYRAKNAALFLEKVRAAAALRPKHPTLQYQFAIAQAINGASDGARRKAQRESVARQCARNARRAVITCSLFPAGECPSGSRRHLSRRSAR